MRVLPNSTRQNSDGYIGGTGSDFGETSWSDNSSPNQPEEKYQLINKIINLAKKMITLSGMRLDRDIEIKFTGLRPGEKLYEELLSTDENTLPTHHPKILIAKVSVPSYAYMDIQMNLIQDVLVVGDNNELVSKIKEVIPEYKSNNSIFEKLDKVTVNIKRGTNF